MPETNAGSWWSGPARVIVAAVIGLAVLPLLVLAAPFLALVASLKRWRKRRLQRRFQARWGAEGKRLLLVYSNSPHWQAYIEERWLPRIGPLAVVMNWSERSRWSDRHPVEADIFRMWAGDREFNPLAIVIPAQGRVQVIRFWKAFRDYKHGRDRGLRAAEAQLEDAVGVSLRSGP